MTRIAPAFLTLFLVLFGTTAPAFAQDRELLGTYRSWNTFREDVDGATMCYAVAIPEEQSLSRRGRQRGDVFFFITSSPARDVANQVNVVIGYPIDEDSTPMIRIGNEDFEMFGQGNRTWLREDDQTNALLSAMRRGSRMTVTGRSSSGTDSTDRYSLMGVSAALDSIRDGCQ